MQQAGLLTPGFNVKIFKFLKTMSQCKSCKAEIIWQKTPSGKVTPVNPDGSSHWATCPSAKEFKSK